MFTGVKKALDKNLVGIVLHTSLYIISQIYLLTRSQFQSSNTTNITLNESAQNFLLRIHAASLLIIPLLNIITKGNFLIWILEVIYSNCIHFYVFKYVTIEPSINEFALKRQSSLALLALLFMNLLVYTINIFL